MSKFQHLSLHNRGRFAQDPGVIVSSCEGKERFDSFKMVMEVAERRKRRTGKGARKVAYRCRVCRGYHIATADHDRVKRRREEELLGPRSESAESADTE